ncbi:serpin B4 isoform X3 [Rhipicephalus sanguineus]|uniref:serpin B4 isoform X3 n=1 Tax=Rhipicephalus sanguineus TaxID=34632 RepID=UPI0020C25BA1|nr:serpin B4 isoform X3 [Rhipicephalus sanguineus]
MAVNLLGDSVLNFAVDLYGHLKPKDGRKGNVFFSPFSISAALSMALGGARNKTAKELSTVLRVPDGAQIHNHFSDFFSKLPSYAADVKLHIANRMYCEQTFPVLENYLSLLRDSYGATIESVDFRNGYETVRLQANAWVERETESKIKDLLPGGSVNERTSLILINAIYFKGLWASQFRPDATHPSDFHLDSNSKKQVDMMFHKDSYSRARCEELDVEALEIPYQGDKTSMVIILPNDVEGLSKLEKRLTASKLGNLLENLRGFFDVELYLPKFKLEQAINLKGVLKEMGIKDFFSSDAELSAICEKDKLTASDVVHKAFVEVNEEGTEAAAATAVMMAACCLSSTPPQTYKFIVDRPFMFVVRSHDPDVVLFMGSVRDL